MKHPVRGLFLAPLPAPLAYWLGILTWRAWAFIRIVLPVPAGLALGVLAAWTGWWAGQGRKISVV